MSMITHNLEQGSHEWNMFRAWPNKNASDAPAMMNVSPYKSRADLIREKATGITPEIDTMTQRRFDDGHRFEALARVLAEEIIGDDLYPVVGSNDGYSASFDGLTMDEKTAFEHKTLNDELRKVMVDGCAGADLPMLYQVQNEQQCMVSECEKVLFMASKWDENDELIEERHCWYFPNMELRQQIINGWIQFDKDVSEYEHVEHQEKPQAEPMESFLVPVVQVKGELAIISNLDLFGQQLRSFVGNMTKDPQDDQDFANLESAVKKLKEAEDALEKAEGYALAQFADVNTMRQTVSELKELARSHRLTSEKLVKSQKELIKMRIFNSGKERFAEHVAELQKEIIGVALQIQQPDFAGAMKNKRTIASLHDAVDTTLANAKIEADSMAKGIREKLSWLNDNAADYKFLFNDLQYMIDKNGMESFMAIVHRRIDEHKQAEAAKLEAERNRIQAEAEAKAKADQERKLEAERAKIRAEEAAKARVKAEEERRIAEAERKRLRDEQIEHQKQLIKEQVEAEARESGSEVDESLIDDAANLLQMVENDKAAAQSVIETVTITREEYEQLLGDSELLNALRSAGVDNWDGYSIAISMIQAAA